MKIINPNFKNDGQLMLEKYEAQIAGYIASLDSTTQFIDFEKIKADILGFNLPDVTIDDLTDGKLEKICQHYQIRYVR